MCSMISGQCDELRKTADELDERAKAYAPTGRNVLSPMLRSAADTIFELRGDLQRANDAVQDAEHDESMAWDRVRKAEAENAKLRELVRKYSEYTDQDRCEGCACKSRCSDGDVDECWQLTEIRELARELGVGVDE